MTVRKTKAVVRGTGITGVGAVPLGGIVPFLPAIHSAALQSPVFTFPTGNVNISTETITVTAHGFSNGTRVSFTSTGTLPSPLVSGNTYYVINAATNTFQVSATEAGTAVDLTSVGSGTHTVIGLRDGWMLCSGTSTQRTVHSGARLAGAIIPDLSDNRFLHGSTVAWSNANDANAAYKSQPSYDNPVSLTYSSADAVARSNWFQTGSFTPTMNATAPGPAPYTQPFGTYPLAHTHTFNHTHDSGTLSGQIKFNTAVINIGSASWTSSITGTIGGNFVPASTSSPNSTDIAGYTATAPMNTGPSGLSDVTSPHSHTFTASAPGIVPNIRTTFAAAGNFTPTGTVSGITDRRPVYLSCLYMIRVH